MSSSSAPSRVLLRWSGEGLVFRGGPDGAPEITVDSAVSAGPSPTQLLLLSLAGCMGVDVRLILEKSRVPVETLEVEVEGYRAQTEPKRFEAIRLTYRIHGPSEADQPKLHRAIQLSRDKYCSVLHSLRSDIDVDVRVERV